MTSQGSNRGSVDETEVRSEAARGGGGDRLHVSRRSLLRGGLGVTAATLAGAHLRPARAAGGGRIMAPRSLRQAQQSFEGETLRIFSMDGPLISGALNVHKDRFTEEFGAEVEVITAPFDQLFTRAQQVAVSGGGDFDVLLLANSWVADFVSLGYVVPLDPFIERDVADPLLAYDDIPDGIKLKDSFGGQTPAWIVDNDNHTMFYRKDVLGDARWQEEYRTATGKDLPNPPQTLTEFVEVAKFFTGKEWGDAGLDKYGFITCVRRGAQAYWYAYGWTAPYTVVPKDKAPAQGIYLFKPDMEPLVNTAGFVRGLTEFVDTIKNAMRPGLDTQRQDVITDMINGSTLMSIDWGDTGPASIGPDSVVNGKLGFALSPGVNEYYDWQTDTWVTVEGEPHRTPAHAYNGWSYYITSQATNPDLAWAWIKFHSSPEISAIDVANAGSGYQPWRISHSTNLEPWVEAGWSEEDAQPYIQTILDATDHPNAVFDVRVPGAARYQETLELHVNRAINEEANPQQAMDDCANEWNAITDELGRDAQVQAYGAHLGLMQQAAGTPTA